MSRRPLATLASALVLGVGLSGAPSASAFTGGIFGWEVLGSLTPKKLNEPVTLPRGSSFSGEVDFQSVVPLYGTLTGTIQVPPFKASLKLLGLLPTEVGVTFTQVGKPLGTFKEVPPANCPGIPTGEICATFNVPAQANLGLTMVGTLGLGLPTHCETSEPVNFLLHLTQQFTKTFTVGLHFTGTTTIPSITCSGLEALTLAPLLTVVMSGPDNAFDLTIRTPQ